MPKSLAALGIAETTLSDQHCEMIAPVTANRIDDTDVLLKAREETDSRYGASTALRFYCHHCVLPLYASLALDRAQCAFDK
jgi:hypothetical protein